LPFDLCGVENDQGQIGDIVVQKMAYHLFIIGETVQIVDAWQVDDFHHVTTEQNFSAE
jgi:hypothetical protein